MRKIGWVIAGLVIVFLAYFGWNYYVNTYQPHEAYAVVPTKVPEKKKTIDDDGNTIADSYTYEYHLTFERTDGQTTKLTVDLSDSDPKPFKPNSIVKADVSNKRVIKGPYETSKSSVPDKIQKRLGIK